MSTAKRKRVSAMKRRQAQTERRWRAALERADAGVSAFDRAAGRFAFELVVAQLEREARERGAL